MKKRFPRFSLRALVIAVLGIAVCWTLTATWGVSDILGQIQPEYKPVRNGNTVQVFFEGTVISDSMDRRYTATALFPFYIKVEMKGCRLYRANSPEPELILSDSMGYFWFFGYVAHSIDRHPRK